MVVEVGPDTTSYTDTDVENGTTYAYTVAAWSLLGDGRAASTGPVTPLQIPYPPDVFQVTAGDHSARIEWAENDGPWVAIEGFRIYRFGPDDQRTLAATVGADARAYTDAPLENDTGYGYEVTAFNALFESQPSPIAGAYPQGPREAVGTRAGLARPDARSRPEGPAPEPPAATQRPPLVHAGSGD
jgi:hypothetical protein